MKKHFIVCFLTAWITGYLGISYLTAEWANPVQWLISLADREKRNFILMMMFNWISLSVIISFYLSGKWKAKEKDKYHIVSQGDMLTKKIRTNSLLGIAGEDLESGDCVVIGEDGIIVKAGIDNV